MKLRDIVIELRSAYAAATVQLPPEAGDTATNEDLEGKPLPLTMYETVYTYRGDDGEPAGGEVKKVKVTRFGISTELGATAPSISFVGWDNCKARGSASLFYMTAEQAQAEIDFCMAFAARERAGRRLDELTRQYLPELLDALESAYAEALERGLKE